MTIAINGTPSVNTIFRGDTDAGILAEILTGSRGPFSINGISTDVDLGAALSNLGHTTAPLALNGPTGISTFASDVDAGALLTSILSAVTPTKSNAVFSANSTRTTIFTNDIDIGDAIAQLASSSGPFSANGYISGDQDIGSLLSRLSTLTGPLVINGPLQIGAFSDDVDFGELLLQLINRAPVADKDAVFSINGSAAWPFENTIDAGYLLSRIVGDASQSINGAPFGNDADIGSILMSIAGRSGTLSVNSTGVGEFSDDIDVGELLSQLVDMLGIGIFTQEGLEQAIGAYVTEDYLQNISSWHRGNAPKFVDTVRNSVKPAATLQQFLSDIPSDFDLDTAAGVQLDAVGKWVGRTRYVDTPLEGVYFSFDTVDVGFDHGVWRGQFDVADGVERLDDETYRLLLRGKIAANNWDGTMSGAISALGYIFNESTIPGSRIFIQDYQDMSILIGISGRIPSALFKSLVGSGEIPIKPEGVNTQYAITTVDGAQIFGFDASNKYFGGMDAGAWPALFS